MTTLCILKDLVISLFSSYGFREANCLTVLENHLSSYVCLETRHIIIILFFYQSAQEM